jgi:rod shape determining protein RodA
MVPMGLVMLQPDLGSALAFISILMGCLYWAGTPATTIFFLVSPMFSLFLSIQPWVWGGYIVLLLVLLFYRNAFLSEKVSIFLVNAAAGAIALPAVEHAGSRTRRTASWSSWTRASTRAAPGTT